MRSAEKIRRDRAAGPAPALIDPVGRRSWNRREFIGVAAASAVATALGCSREPSSSLREAVRLAESRRPHSGRVVEAVLTADRTSIDLGGPLAVTTAYNEMVPGPLVRAKVGDEVEVVVHNRLPKATSVHWHGIALRNDMDGASPASPDIPQRQTFVYRFSVPHPGTYWAHPHTGLDADTGLYLPVIVDDPNDPGDYDAEWIIMLDDWTDGTGSSPSQIYDGLRKAPMAAHHMPGMPSHRSDEREVPGVGGVEPSVVLGGDAGDVTYPYYLANGRVPMAPDVLAVKPGHRVRIRLINAGSDTAFRVALSSHRLTITHTDGYPVVPRDFDAVLIGMGERYDMLVTVGDGGFALVAEALGKRALARALLISGVGEPPPVGFMPSELNGQLATTQQLHATHEVALPEVESDTHVPLTLNGSMMRYDWSINGTPFSDAHAIPIAAGRRVNMTFTNTTSMWHPMHLHGHTFQVVRRGALPGPRKDTLIVLPGQMTTVTFEADNPGEWMLHCHNTYHQEAGMMTSLMYS